MKFSVFSLFALSLFLLVSCKNNSGAPTEGGSTDAGTVAGAEAVAPITLSSDPSKLNEQIMTEFLAARKVAREFTANYDESFEVIKTMKMAYASKDDAGKEKIKQLVGEAMKFREDYETIMGCTDQLDALSQQLGKNEVKIEDAQKLYAEIRVKMLAAQSRLPAEKGNVENASSNLIKHSLAEINVCLKHTLIVGGGCPGLTEPGIRYFF